MDSNLPALAAFLDGAATADGRQTGNETVPRRITSAFAAGFLVMRRYRRWLLLVLHGLLPAVVLAGRRAVVAARWRWAAAVLTGRRPVAILALRRRGTVVALGGLAVSLLRCEVSHDRNFSGERGPRGPRSEGCLAGEEKIVQLGVIAGSPEEDRSRRRLGSILD